MHARHNDLAGFLRGKRAFLRGKKDVLRLGSPDVGHSSEGSEDKRLLMIFVQQQAVLSPPVAKVVYAVKVTGGDNPITVRRERSTLWVISEFSSIVRGLWTVLRSLS